MSNEHLIKSAHIWALVVLLACGILVLAGGASTTNSGGPQNSNSTTSKTQNSNSTKNANRKADSTSAKGERAGMASLSSQDRDFLTEAAMGGLMEVELGRVAAQQGASDVVKQFGQRMVDDHSKANSELMSLASSKGITLPADLDEKHRNEVAKFSKMTGTEFDRAYAKMMLNDHIKDVAAFEKESTKGVDPDLKAFAAKTLPTLQEHLQLAKPMNSQVGNPSDSKSSNKNSNSNRP